MEDEDGVVGPEGDDPLPVPVNQFAGVAASVNPQEHLNAIEDLLDLQCRQARTEGKDSYRAAIDARYAVVEAVLEGATTVPVDLPAALVAQLAQLGLTCRPKATVVPVQPRVAESKDGPELAGALAAAEAKRLAGPQQRASVMGVKPSGMDRGLTQQQIYDSWVGRGSGRRANLHVALEKGNSAAVIAFMGSLKGAGLSPQQISELLAAKESDGDPGLFFAKQYGKADAETAYMNGLMSLQQQNLITTQQIDAMVSASKVG
ncbi:MAG: hypothetical protein H7346_09620 [Burkholderiaceae bacterium]|nr:hypothetical protein [Burkholderiaceae bacterium]